MKKVSKYEKFADNHSFAGGVLFGVFLVNLFFTIPNLMIFMASICFILIGFYFERKARNSK